jgi:hypothetical protein
MKVKILKIKTEEEVQKSRMLKDLTLETERMKEVYLSLLIHSPGRMYVGSII